MGHEEGAEENEGAEEPEWSPDGLDTYHTAPFHARMTTHATPNTGVLDLLRGGGGDDQNEAEVADDECMSYCTGFCNEPDENGCIIIPGAEALWDSGAATRVGGLRICDLKQKTFGIDLPRPTGYPDLEIDLEVAIRRGRRLATERERWFFGGVEPPRGNPTGIRDH